MAHIAAGLGPGSGPGPEIAAAQHAAATDGPGPDPAETCATARWPLPVYFIINHHAETYGKSCEHIGPG